MPKSDTTLLALLVPFSVVVDSNATTSTAAIDGGVGYLLMKL